MALDPLVPANDLSPITRIAALQLPVLVPYLVDAHKALAEFKGVIETIPRPELYSELLLIEEAQESCRIENIITTQDALYRALSASSGEPLRAAEKEVLAYWVAMRQAQAKLTAAGAFTPDLPIFIMQQVLNEKWAVRESNVRLRAVSGMTIYTPPDAQYVPALLNDLMDYLNSKSDGTDPLIKLALAHYQFEAIHPFVDGNGRTGRVLNQLVLHHYGLTASVAPYLSKAILQTRSDYYHNLRMVEQTGEYTAWTQYILQQITSSSKHALQRVQKLRSDMETSHTAIKLSLGTRYRDGLTELLFARPYARIEHLERSLHINRDTASDLLRQLANDEILLRIKQGRNVLYINPKLTDGSSIHKSE